jgi:hypothetical protein
VAYTWDIIYFFSEKLDPLKKAIILQMTDSAMPVLHFVKPPAEIISV